MGQGPGGIPQVHAELLEPPPDVPDVLEDASTHTQLMLGYFPGPQSFLFGQSSQKQPLGLGRMPSGQLTQLPPHATNTPGRALSQSTHAPVEGFRAVAPVHLSTHDPFQVSLV